MKRITALFALLALAFSLVGVDDVANASDRRGGRQPQTSSLRKPDGTPVSTLINTNAIAGWIRNDGWSARIPSSGNSGVFYPRGTAGAIFQDGIVWGGNVNDGGSQVLRVGGQTFQIGTVAGRVIDPDGAGRGALPIAANPNDPDVRIYRIRRDFRTVDLKQDAGEVNEKGLSSVTDGDIAAVRAQYASDWVEWPASQGAPYYDANGDGQYTPGFNADLTPKLRPQTGEAFDAAKHADEPGYADADQVIWFVCNDLNIGKTLALYGSNPIGLELQVTLWAYNRTDPLANVYFKAFKFIYKGTPTTPAGSRITDMYVAQWADVDMGDAGDDFAGSDTSLSLVYVYNGDPLDGEYAKFGLKPPAIGYDFLQGPIVAGAPTDSAVFGLKRVRGKKNLPMTAAFYFAAGGTFSDPPFTREGTIQWYNLLRGLTPRDGSPFVHPAVPGPTKFWLDGNPVAETNRGRVDGAIDQPGDRRIGACAGPFTMVLGDTQEVVVGVVAGIGGDFKSSISVMKNNDIAVQNAYNDLFDLPKAPPSPKLKGVALNKRIVLDWGSDLAQVRASEDFNRKGYAFEGYNVYQLPSPSATFSQAVRLATYDKEGNGVRTIFDDVFDVALGIIVRVVKQRGTDNGIQRQLVIDEDKIRSAPLVNGQQYYFAVTSYGHNPSDQALTHALESSMQIITVVPKTSDPGYGPVSSRYGEALRVTNLNQGIQSDGGAVPVMVDPTVSTGKTYQVRFRNVLTTFRYSASYPTFDTVYTVTQNQLNWTLYRGQDSIYNDVNQGPTSPIDPGIHVTAVPPRRPTDFDALPVLGSPFNYPIIDGFHLPVSGPPPQLSEERSRFLSGGNANGRGWLGAVGRFAQSTSALRSQVTTANDIPIFYLGAVGNGVTPDKYRDVEFRFGAGGSLTQKGYRYRRIGEYLFQNYTDVPFQVWDVSNPAVPRQLNCGWRDNNNDGIWNPNGGVEVIFVGTTTYDGATPTVFSYGTIGGTNTNSLPRGDYQCVAEWISTDGTAATITASVILVSPNRVLSANDLYVWTAPAAALYDAKTAKTDVSLINAFPNPYYGFNRAEPTRQSRFVTFNHMPAQAEIRIFNLAGVLVRAIEKNDPSQYMNWNLQNQNNLPVASGVYIAYINMPQIGATKTLKLIVVQEQQFLDNF